MNLPKTIEIQKQIRENSSSIHEYFKDLNDWQKEINAKDKIINTNFKPKDPKLYNKINEKETSISLEQQALLEKKYKRDLNPVQEYYDHWNNIKLDDDTEPVDQNDLLSKNSKLNKMKNSETSNAAKNSNIILTNNRILNNNSEDYIEKLKNEANAYFAIKNFNKSIELYNSALELINKETNKKHEKSKINIYNNKGNSYLKQNLFKEAVNDFNIVLHSDPNNVKALFRRGHCYMKLNILNLAYLDFIKAKEFTDPTNLGEVNIIKENLEQCIKEINSLLVSEKKKMEKFEYDTKTKFIKLKIHEISSESFKENDIKEFTNKGVADIDSKIINKNKTPSVIASTISNEEIVKFVYDLTKENLTASSFKYALRNFKILSEKIEFLKVK